MNFMENSDWAALESRIEKLKYKIIKPQNKIRNNSKKLYTERNSKTKIISNKQYRPNHKRYQSAVDTSRMQLFISSEHYQSELLQILKKHVVHNNSLSKDITSLNNRFIVSNSNF